MIPLASFALAGCLAIGANSGHILAKDLAAALPAFANVPPDTPLALAPVPGTPRVFHLPELRRLAAQFKVSPAPETEICAQMPVATLEPARILDAMKLQVPGSRIEILDFGRQPAPEGQLEFPVAGLHQGPAGGYWHGFVRYGLNRRFAVWAKVKVLVMAAHVIASEELRPGHPIDAGQVRIEMSEDAPASGIFAASIEEVAGRVPRRSIPAGTPLRLPWLETPKDVMRGESVRVEVTDGGAHLEFEAMAEASGAVGDTIPVLNPASKKRFPARVEGKGRVSVKRKL